MTRVFGGPSTDKKFPLKPEKVNHSAGKNIVYKNNRK